MSKKHLPFWVKSTKQTQTFCLQLTTNGSRYRLLTQPHQGWGYLVCRFRKINPFNDWSTNKKLVFYSSPKKLRLSRGSCVNTISMALVVGYLSYRGISKELWPSREKSYVPPSPERQGFSLGIESQLRVADVVVRGIELLVELSNTRINTLLGKPAVQQI